MCGHHEMAPYYGWNGMPQDRKTVSQRNLRLGATIHPGIHPRGRQPATSVFPEKLTRHHAICEAFPQESVPHSSKRKYCSASTVPYHLLEKLSGRLASSLSLGTRAAKLLQQSTTWVFMRCCCISLRPHDNPTEGRSHEYGYCKVV